jgi:hypothetical protein
MNVRMALKLAVLLLAVVVKLGIVSQPAMAKTPMSVEEAYRAIPHRQTPFDAGQAKMSAEEKAYLKQLFHLADQAMVSRVEAMAWFQTGGKRGIDYAAYTRRIDEILARHEDLLPPRKLTGVHRLIGEAVRDQKAYFTQWQASYEHQQRFNPSNKSVRSAHKKLIDAYGYLMKLYPRETPYNQQAFFDHLCALDFL